MSTYATRDDLLKDFVTQDIKLPNDRKMLIRELPADVFQTLIETGAIDLDTGEVNLENVNFTQIAASVIIDPKTKEAMFDQDEVQLMRMQMGFSAIQAAVLGSFAITEFGNKDEVEDETSDSPKDESIVPTS